MIIQFPIYGNFPAPLEEGNGGVKKCSDWKNHPLNPPRKPTESTPRGTFTLKICRRGQRPIAVFTLKLLSILMCFGQVQQITIPRIEQMPNEPSPYNVRDWKEVAVQYDAFIYDLNKTGQYLPLIALKNNGFNYPENQGFQIVTYVGTNSAGSNEAINVLPSLVGATLVGIDKSNQNGKNWVLMSQDFFNKKNGLNLYLNSVSTSTGVDWWYETMPSLYFYQLYDLYPGIGGEADFQFTSVADGFAEAVRAMGGGDTPWSKAFMNYRAWDYASMQANPGGVKEPEAAGVYAWVLYHAYKKTGKLEYLKAAEWSMEFLNDWNENPAYEIQLPYGTYVAAKMNAELGTKYDIEKLVNWSFDRGALRGWGTIVGRWNGFDVSGLVGEANDNGNDYAFQMNGVQHAAALVPMLRYDKRFARAIGKWMLNLANATRLFYPGFLPDFLQDASEWSNANDPDRVIGYEALREKWEGNAPFSTGDALRGGWAQTNLALYGTSSIGYLGGMMSKTNDEKIFKINLLKTDFFRENAYPTYLFFNPYSIEKSVQIDLGEEPVDLYETLSETFLQRGVSGTVEISIPADAALIIVQAPSNGTITYQQNKLLVDGVIVDHMQSAVAFTYPPRIQALAAEKQKIEIGDSVQVFATVFDQDSEDFNYSWSTNGGSIVGEGSLVTWTAPASEGAFEIQLVVADEMNNRDTTTLLLQVVAEINLAPQIIEFSNEVNYIGPGEPLAIRVNAADPNDDPLTYAWNASGGLISGMGSNITWTAPETEGIYTIEVQVQDDQNASTSASIEILVKEFVRTNGNLIADYPFSGNANDVSGNELHGMAFGARLTLDRLGNNAQAYFFDGANDRIQVSNEPILNIQNAITVSAWFKADQLPDKEVFLVSHGSWQNRWKISITPERKIRWTINTTDLIADLDSKIPIEVDTFYQVTATFDGKQMALYLNGELHSFREARGDIRQTFLDLLIGQMLPDNTDFNFRGTIDEVKIFDYALVPNEVAQLFETGVVTSTQESVQPEQWITLMPNPARDQLSLRFAKTFRAPFRVAIYNLRGQLLKTETIQSGNQITTLDVENLIPGIYVLHLVSTKDYQTIRFLKQ